MVLIWGVLCKSKDGGRTEHSTGMNRLIISWWHHFFLSRNELGPAQRSQEHRVSTITVLLQNESRDQHRARLADKR